MTILDLVAQHLENLGFVKGPYNPGCFIFVTHGGVKVKICLVLGDGRVMDFIRTKEPTIIMIYKGWIDDMKSTLIDLNDPKSFEEIGKIVNEA